MYFSEEKLKTYWNRRDEGRKFGDEIFRRLYNTSRDVPAERRLPTPEHRKYHRLRTLPPMILTKFKNEFNKNHGNVQVL